MYTVIMDISENESLKTMLTEAIHHYVDYKNEGEVTDDDRLNKVRGEVTKYLKKMLTTDIDVSVVYGIGNEDLDVEAKIKITLK